MDRRNLSLKEFMWLAKGYTRCLVIILKDEAEINFNSIKGSCSQVQYHQQYETCLTSADIFWVHTTTQALCSGTQEEQNHLPPPRASPSSLGRLPNAINSPQVHFHPFTWESRAHRKWSERPLSGSTGSIFILKFFILISSLCSTWLGRFSHLNTWEDTVKATRPEWDVRDPL